MTHDKYVEITKTTEQMFGRVIEEAGETLAAAGKIIRFGWYSYNPELPVDERETNREWLRREMRDLGHAMFKLEQAFQAEDERVAEDMQNA